MIEILDGKSSELFNQFRLMVVRGFLAVRKVMDDILSITSSMADSSYPCFMHKNDNLINMRKRFCPDASDIQAAKYMNKKIDESAATLTTILYDGIQKLQNNIYSEVWM